MVPAAILMAMAEEMLAGHALALRAVDRAKFRRPVGPGQPLTIQLDRNGASGTLRWLSDGETIAEARVQLAALEAAV